MKNLIRVDSSPEKTVKTPKTPISIKHRAKRNPGPPKFYGDRRFMDQVTLGTENNSVVDSHDELLISFSSANSPRSKLTYSTASHSDYLTPIEDIPRHTTLVAGTTQGPFSSVSSRTTKAECISSPLVEVSSNTG